MDIDSQSNCQNGVYCHCCKKEFPSFFPHGRMYRRNSQCPNCFSLERHRLLWVFMKAKTNILTDQIKLLHVAPERPLFNKFSRMKNIDYMPVDKFMLGYQYPHTTVNMDVTQLDFDDNSFDVILSIHVLDHIVDDHQAMKEFYRVLKPRSWSIHSIALDPDLEKTYEDPTITDPSMRELHFGQHDRVRRYGLDYPDRLRQVGFDVRVDDFVNEFSDQEIQRFGFHKEEKIFLCTKN